MSDTTGNTSGTLPKVAGNRTAVAGSSVSSGERPGAVKRIGFGLSYNYGRITTAYLHNLPPGRP